MSKTILSGLAAAFIAVASLGAPAAEAGFRLYGTYDNHKVYKPFHGWHAYGFWHYGKCAVWSYSGKYCLKWW